jgi:DNA-binding NtrC family response regulator
MITWQPGVTLEEVEKQAILLALKFYQNNKTQTARSLGIAIRTLDAKLDKYNGVTTAKVDAALVKRTK